MKDPSMTCKNLSCRKYFIRESQAQRYCPECRESRRRQRAKLDVIQGKKHTVWEKNYKVTLERITYFECEVLANSPEQASRLAWMKLPVKDQREFKIKTIKYVPED